MGEKIETQTRRGENDPRPVGEIYYRRVIESFKDSIHLENGKDGCYELAINHEVLCVETAYVVDDKIVDYHAFVVATGGPHAEFRTTNEGKTYSFHYWDWYGSDEYSCCVIGSPYGFVDRVLGIYFEC
jgi:hypothetical protein